MLDTGEVEAALRARWGGGPAPVAGPLSGVGMGIGRAERDLRDDERVSKVEAVAADEVRAGATSESGDDDHSAALLLLVVVVLVGDVSALCPASARSSDVVSSRWPTRDDDEDELAVSRRRRGCMRGAPGRRVAGRWQRVSLECQGALW